MLVEKTNCNLAAKLGFTNTDLFKGKSELMNKLVKRESGLQLNLENEMAALIEIYDKLKIISGAVAVSLEKHTEALQVQACKKIAALEKKMIRAEKKKFETQQRQLLKLKTALFPEDNLQERVENFIPFYAKWGNDFIKGIYENSLGLQQEFVVIEEA
jgi:hypothetical protein